MKLAVLGGSFNPIHLGHLALAAAVQKELEYSKIAIIPAFISPFKQQFTHSPQYVSPKDRVHMIELAISTIPYLYCERYEIDKQGVSYTIDTINYLYKKFSKPNEISKEPLDGKIGLIIGDDLAESFPHWRGSSEIMQKADIIIGTRNTIPEMQKNETSSVNYASRPLYSYPCTELKNTVLAISSTAIRNAVKAGTEFKHFLPFSVYNYIGKKGLYL